MALNAIVIVVLSSHLYTTMLVIAVCLVLIEYLVHPVCVVDKPVNDLELGLFAIK